MRFHSLKITLVCLILSIILLFIGTLYQVEYGVLAAQSNIFRVFLVYWQPYGSNLKIPIFPGGYTLSGVLLVNLVASLFRGFKYSFRTLGITGIHIGILLLVLGELISGLFSKETTLSLRVNEKKNYTLDVRKSELAVIRIMDNVEVLEVIFPNSQLIENGILTHANLPFNLHINKVFYNSSLTFDDEKNATVIEKTLSTKDTEIDYLTAWIEVITNQKNQGIWILSSAIEEEQPFYYQGNQYNLIIRPKRNYLPFAIELVEFQHENHPKTNIPKHFASIVKLYSNEDQFDRVGRISMNSPLRYQGTTFYQSSFGDDDRTSILQVVENHLWAMPYLSSSLVIAGLIYQFTSRGIRKT